MGTGVRRRRLRGGPALLVVMVLAASGFASTAMASGPVADDVVPQRARIDLSAYSVTTPELPLGAAETVGPGSALLITIPNEGRFGCTANFVWTSGTKRYLGAAGHCFLPGNKKATHGLGADYNASGVTVQACVDNCDGNFRSMLLVGKWVTLGRVAYARQTDANGKEVVGHDFGVVEISELPPTAVRTRMPVFGGPTGTEPALTTGKQACHFGHGLVAGETFATKARSGVGGGSDSASWMGDFAATFGDSGSAMVTCGLSGIVLQGRNAVGVVTHLGAQVCPCNFGKLTVQQGVVFGTTVNRAIAMAKEAGLTLKLVPA